VFYHVIGVPLLRSVAGFLRKRSPSLQGAAAVHSDDERKSSWQHGPDASSGIQQNAVARAPSATPRPVPWEVPKVAPSTLRRSVWQTPEAPAERPVLPAASRKTRTRLPSTSTLASAVVRQIPRDQIGQRRAIVLMAVFGPPRATDPPP
jgi:hypothetical protein